MTSPGRGITWLLFDWVTGKVILGPWVCQELLLWKDQKASVQASKDGSSCLRVVSLLSPLLLCLPSLPSLKPPWCAPGLWFRHLHCLSLAPSNLPIGKWECFHFLSKYNSSYLQPLFHLPFCLTFGSAGTPLLLFCFVLFLESEHQPMRA